jgi:predicted RNase H-like HicB family nuclease
VTGPLQEPATFVVAVMKDPLDGGWIAMCSYFPGCFSQGETPDEALSNIADAIAGVLSLRAEESPHD